jgi:hypothetical protein
MATADELLKEWDGLCDELDEMPQFSRGKRWHDWQARAIAFADRVVAAGFENWADDVRWAILRFSELRLKRYSFTWYGMICFWLFP